MLLRDLQLPAEAVASITGAHVPKERARAGAGMLTAVVIVLILARFVHLDQSKCAGGALCGRLRRRTRRQREQADIVFVGHLDVRKIPFSLSSMFTAPPLHMRA